MEVLILDGSVKSHADRRAMGCKKYGEESHPHIIIDECKGCGRCIDACPKDCLRFAKKMNGKGYIPAEYIGEGCTGCGICFYNCPEPYAIEVYKKDKE